MKARPAALHPSSRGWPALAAGLALLAFAGSAHAESMDPAFERFVTAESASCRDDAGRYVPGSDLARPAVCAPDNLKFKRFVSQLGFAFAPSAMHSARTTGYGGVDLSLEATYTKISSDRDYWKLGTQGSSDPSSQLAAKRNESPASLLQLYSLKVRKGFGFGLEVAGMVGFMPKTSLIGGGADVRLSLLEGFRRGMLGIFPDVAVGGGVRTITGTPQLQLTIASLDAQISKPLPIQSSSVLTPWIGYQHLWMFGDSGVIDLTPGTNALAYCGYAGNNIPNANGGASDPRKSEADGQPVCTAKGPNAQADFNNNVVFDSVRLKRHRLLVGFNYRYEMLMGGAQFITDLTTPADAQTNDKDKADLKGEERQWTLALELGAAF